MMEDDNTIDYHLTEGEVTKRPRFLTVLCILSFIADSLILVSNLVMTVLITRTIGAEGLTADRTPENITQVLFKGSDVRFTWLYLIVVFVCVIISLWGVIKMWRLQKSGYFMYVAADITALIMGFVYSGFNMLTISLSLLFMILYGLNFKHLK